MCVDPRTPATIVLPSIVGESTPVPPACSRGRSESADNSFAVVRRRTCWLRTAGSGWPERLYIHFGPRRTRYGTYLGSAGPNSRPDRTNWRRGSPAEKRSSLAANLPGVRSGARDARPSHRPFTLSVEGLLFTPGRCRGATGRGQAAKGAPGAPPGVPRRPRATWAPPPGTGKGSTLS